MRALLINPWITDFAAYDLWSKPLGILNIGYYLKELGFEVELIDCLDKFHQQLVKSLNGNLPKTTIYGDGCYLSEEIKKPSVFSDVPRKFKRYGIPLKLFRKLLENIPYPDVILVTSAMTYWYPGVFEAIGLLKQRFRNTPVILGGIYPTLCYKHAKKNSGADFIYKGNNIVEIINIIEKITNKELDISKLNFKREINYFYSLYHKVYYITLRTSGGCPFRCSWCGWYILDDKRWEQAPEEVVQDIEYFYETYKIKNFSFYDDCLLYNSQVHIIKILNMLKKKKIKCYFHTPNGLSVKFLTQKIAFLLKETGFIHPRLSFDTFQKTKEKEFTDAFNYLKKAGFDSKYISVYTLVGLPSQSIDEIKDCIEFLSNFKIRLYLEEYSPVPYTPDFEKTGLSLESDPLLHNNTIFPLYRKDYEKFQKLKDLVHTHNRTL